MVFSSPLCPEGHVLQASTAGGPHNSSLTRKCLWTPDLSQTCDPASLWSERDFCCGLIPFPLSSARTEHG